MRSNIIAVLDLGSSKIVCLIAKVASDSSLEIIGIGYNGASGIHSGFITDIKKAEECIISAINSAEKMAGLTVDALTISISGLRVYSKIVEVETNLDGKTITNNLLSNIIRPEIPLPKEGEEENPKDKEERENFQIIHSIPISFSIDGYGNIQQPIGMSGNSLTAKIHLVGVHKTLLKNLEAFFSKNGINSISFVNSAIASAYACLNEDEKNLGAILLDIGSHQSDIVVYENEMPKFVATVQIGGSIITRDIAKCLNLSIEQAERVKILYGEAIFSSEADNSNYINLNKEEDSDSEYETVIKKSVLINIISARVEEMIEVIFDKIKNNYDNHYNIQKVVLTGGGSFISGYREIIKHNYGKACRIAKPKIIEGISESLKTQNFSSAIGLVLFEYERISYNQHNKKRGYDRGNSGNLKKFLNWIKNTTN
ncbi:MAG: cell division protein FtsA [Alphaproteobacteria bacterium]|jgi:cell division protein FtsA